MQLLCSSVPFLFISISQWIHICKKTMFFLIYWSKFIVDSWAGFQLEFVDLEFVEILCYRMASLLPLGCSYQLIEFLVSQFLKAAFFPLLQSITFFCYVWFVVGIHNNILFDDHVIHTEVYITSLLTQQPHLHLLSVSAHEASYQCLYAIVWPYSHCFNLWFDENVVRWYADLRYTVL